MQTDHAGVDDGAADPSQATIGVSPRPRPGPLPAGSTVVELVRLVVVVLFTAAGYAVAPTVTDLVTPELVDADPDRVRLVTSVLGALVGYVLGGMSGRGVMGGVDTVEARLYRVEAAVLIAGALGATAAAMLAAVLFAPVLVLPGRVVTVPLAVVLTALVVYIGARLGAARGGDLLRYVGARGRLEITSPSRGAGTKLVDSSALVDGRVVDVARGGFLEGTLVVPRFVLDELQRLADTEEPRRRNAGRRGLDTLRTLQAERLLGVEVTDDDVPEFAEVDAKLAAMARQRRAALITVDANLARVAEVSGVRVLNLHALAEALRPPVVPGERLRLLVSRPGREPGQGVGHLPDGTMVVIERAAEQVGREVTVEVTSLLQTRNGRMVFAAPVQPA
ncbi:MAG TPA: TRAM domain-containing protein [Nitriliruptorales bacterium]|nr:TRAM domain-containing protein [Nitriliruptorales bacterium]